MDDYLFMHKLSGPRDVDKDGWFPLHKAIQDTKDDPKLIKVIPALMNAMDSKDCTCRLM